VKVTLAITYHDPAGHLSGQIERVLPVLTAVFAGLAVQASSRANEQSLALFTRTGALVQREPAAQLSERPKLGRARREAISLALQLEMPSVLYCDGDRVLHWAERYPEELGQVVGQLGRYDLTVLGRTARAYNSHPRVQRDTESLVNDVFRMISGYDWDIMVGARGLSRRAVEAILHGCPDEEISTDVSWPLYLQAVGGFSLGYIAAEGLEFETAAGCEEEIAAAGGYQAWLQQRDANWERWARRLEIARVHVEAMIPFSKGRRPTSL